MMTPAEIRAFKREIPDLATLYRAAGQFSFDRDRESDRHTKLSQLAQRAIQIHGSLTNMPSGCWGSEAHYLQYIHLIQELNDEVAEAKQQLILTILTQSAYVRLLIRHGNLNIVILNAATQNTLKAAIQHPGNTICTLLSDSYYHSRLVGSCNDHNKTLLIQTIKAKQHGKILPAFNEIEQFSAFMHLDTIRTQMESELIENNGVQFKRLVKRFSDIQSLMKTYPHQHQQIITLAESKSGGLMSYIDTVCQLQDLCWLFPDKKEKFKADIVDPRQGHLIRLITHSGDMVYFIALYPDHETQILDVVASQGGKPFLKDKNEFFKHLKSSPMYFQKVFKRLTHQYDTIKSLVGTCKDLIQLIQYMPEYMSLYQRLMLDKISESNSFSFIGSLDNLVVITHYFPELEEELYSLYFNPKNELCNYGLIGATHDYPSWSQSLWIYIQSNARLYAHYVKNVETHQMICKNMMQSKDVCGKEIVSKRSATHSPIILNWHWNRKTRKYHETIASISFPQYNFSFHKRPDPTTYLPHDFRGLLKADAQNHVLNVCTHGSKNDSIIKILTDGILYPRQESHVYGLSRGFDLDRGDAAMCFTTPFGHYLDDYITFSTPLLCGSQYHQDAQVVFKFYDWSMFPSSIKIPVTDRITLQCHFPQFTTKEDNVEYIYFDFHVADDTGHAVQIPIKIQETLTYGYQGLNQYLRLYIFKIIEAFPEDKKDIRNEIYAHFKSLSSEALFNKLTQIAQMMFSNSELNFLGKVYLDQAMIKSVTLHPHTIDFDEIRGCIKQNDVVRLNILLSRAATFYLLQRSFFLTKGFLDYAQKCEADAVVKYIKLNFESTLDIENITHRKNILMNIKPTVIDKVYTLLATPYPHADDKIIWNNLTVYRPNHCSVDAVLRAFVSRYIIRLLSEYGIETYQTQSKLLDLSKVAMTLLFATTGRESEISIREDRETYLRYRKNSGLMFYDAFKNTDTFEDVELEHYREELVALGDPLNTNPLHVVMNISHKALLPRCMSAMAMENEIAYIRKFFRPEVADRITGALIDYSTRLLHAAGYTQIRGERVNERFVSLAQRDQFENFVDILAHLPEPSLFDLKLSPSEGIPTIQLQHTTSTLNQEKIVFSIPARSRELLANIIKKSKSYVGFFYRGQNDDYRLFAQCLYQMEDSISKSVLDNLKTRYPFWNAGIANELIRLVADIENIHVTPQASASTLTRITP